MQTSKWNRFVLLLWKNWIIQKRHTLQTVVEVLVPVLFALLLVLFRSLVDPDIYPEPRIFDARNSTPSAVELFHREDNYNIFYLREQNVTFNLAYYPQNAELKKLFGKVEEHLNLNESVGVNSVAELERELLENNYYAGIEFDESYRDQTVLPAKLNFAIRFPATLRTVGFSNPLRDNWRTNLLFPQFQTEGPRNNYSEMGGYPSGYWEEGFANLQSAIFMSFADIKLPTETVPDIYVSRFPYPPFTKDSLLEALDSFVPLIIILSFMYPTVNLVKFVTVEKEAQLKEAMKIMGLENWLHWTAWFTKAMIFNIITVTLMSVVMVIKFYPDSDLAVFTNTDWSVLWIFLLIFSCTTITFAFMISVFFSKANNAATVTGLIWFIFYVPFTLTEQNYNEMGAIDKLLVCLFSNTAMSYGFRLLLRFEGTGEGLQWSNFFTTVTADDNITFGDINLMLILDGIIYLLIALYVEKINPGDFGVPEKWYFPFTKSFWCGVEPELMKENEITDYDNVVEPEPVDKIAGIQIKNLRKVYSNNKIAVDNLTLNMYEDQITVLLGHNGAGKTTTMSMLTGMFPPSSGSAIINGKSILNDLDAVRSSLGLCPQHNVLFSELTVREHIIFYSKLKGLPSSEMGEEIRKYVDLLELQPKINAQSKTLSGGMKRKLSVGVALCGNSKIVICDEPTSGMDPAARRALWDLLQQEKKGRTILLTTHFMDEADILGDRIAIMSEGVLKACGTSFFLKKRFGTGYRLICVKTAKTNVPTITNLLRKYIPNIKVCTNIENELTYELSEDYITIFEVMLSDLENHAEEMGLIGYGVSPTTLEEVFMKVGTDMNKPDILAVEDSSTSQGAIEHLETPLLTGSKLLQNQFIAMMEKKFFYTLRNWYIFLIQVIIPVSFLIMVILISRAFSANSELPRLSLDNTVYRETITVLSRAKNLQDMNSDIADEYEKLFSTNSHKLNVIETGFVGHLIDVSLNIIATVNSRYMIGASIEDNKLTAWFNNAAFHNLPIALGTLHNAVLVGMGCKDCSISITNAPLPYTAADRDKIMKSGQTIGFQFAINMGMSMAFVGALFVLFYIKERVNRAKLLQMVSGVNIHIYWLTSIIFDYCVYLVIALITVITMAIFQEEGYATFDELGRIYLILICFGFGLLPLTYLLSMMFTIPSNGYVRVSMLYIVSGVAFYIVVFVLDALDEESLSEALNWVFSLLPHFGLCVSLSNLNVIQTTKQTCLLYAPTLEAACLSQPDACCVPDLFEWDQPGILRNLFFMLITGCVGYFLLIVIEMGLLENAFYKVKTMFKGTVSSQNHTITDGHLDPDVLREKQRVRNAPQEELSKMSLVLQDMTKYYKRFLAVNQISVGINHSECFGLLGVNGAGKTSTFKMLTGDELISSGEAWVKGISLKTDINKVHQIIGYCPQFDALIEDLTGRETLRMFCLLRGIPNDKINNLVSTLAIELNFIKHIDKKIKEYSGGNKRKVSTAVSLIGNPVVVYLDEPTTGMDPGAKRQLWDMICRIRNAGKTIVLTSHSMEECEALCTKLAIMVNGEFKCIGSSQYLKNKYSQGYLVTIKVQKVDSSQKLVSNITDIKNFIAQSFPGAEIREEYQGLLTYNIPSKNQKWSSLFGILQSNRKKYNIEDYSLSQTSLEQVFLSFTKYQQEENLKATT